MTKSQQLSAYLLRNRFDPLPELDRVRSDTPILRLDSHVRADWLVTGCSAARQVLGDSDSFSTLPPADTREGSLELVRAGNLLQYDPPEHTRLRKLLRPEFTLRRMRRLEPRIKRIVGERLDAMEHSGPPAELMRDFAWPVAALVASELLGVPRDDRVELARLLDIHREAALTNDRQAAAGEALNEYLHQFSAQQRRRPGDDMIGMLVQEHGEEITDEELTGFCTSLLGSGFENMASMIGLGMLVLLEHPEQLALLRSNPNLIHQTMEELIRYLTIIATASPRTALRETIIAGDKIKPGEIVVCLLLAANRDHSLVESPNSFDLSRDPVGHIAFGHGIHHCIGAPLARMELQIALLEIISRFPRLQISVPSEEIRFRSSLSLVYGVQSVPVLW